MPYKSIIIGSGTDTTITIHIHAAAGFKKIKVTASSGFVKFKNELGIGSKDGKTDVLFKAPQVESEDSLSINISVTDEKGQTKQSKINVVVSRSINAMNKLQHIIENVADASDSKFDLKDDKGQNMATAKIIKNPEGGFIAIYHTNTKVGFKVSVATSDDLLNWTWREELGNNASQPYIARSPQGGFVTVWEQTPNNHLRFRYYQSLAKLFQNDYAKQFDAPQTLSTCAEGTPNIISVSNGVIKVGFHYFRNCKVDREALGILRSFNMWESYVNKKLNQAIINETPVQDGKIGDRDQITFEGYPFVLVEAQLKLNDFGSWRVFLYNKQTNQTRMMNISTKGGSKNFANPALTEVNINGRKAVVVTLFVPSQKAAPGEAGELIYYNYIN